MHVPSHVFHGADATTDETVVSTLLVSQLEVSVRHSLDNFCFANATFLAERLFGVDPSAASLALLARTHMAAKDFAAGAGLLHAHHPFNLPPRRDDPTTAVTECCFLFGVCLAEVGRHADAERVLLTLATNHQHECDNPAVHYWLGVCTKRRSTQEAVAQFAEAHRRDPMLFDAYDKAAAIDDSGSAADQNPYGASLAAAASVGGSAAVGERAALALLASFAEAAGHVRGYRSAEAVQLMQSDAMPQRDSAWVTERTALAHFHCGDMPAAAAAFSRLRSTHPWHLSPAMVEYSTVLWHLRSATALSDLAHACLAADPSSPVTLAISGNCYSLAGDSKTATALLTRATQRQPEAPYPHVLKGHELLAIQRPLDAERAFRDALRCDPRCYGALAGLGELCSREGHDEKARECFSAALEINPLPAVHNRLAATFHRDGATRDELAKALFMYDQALKTAPRSFVAQLRRAHVLLRLGNNQAALEALEELAAQAPDDGRVLLALGRTLAASGQATRAITVLSTITESEELATAAKEMMDRISSSGAQETMQ